MSPNPLPKIHPNFSLNGKHFSATELVQFAQKAVNGEEDFWVDCGVFIQEWLDENDSVTVQTSGTTGVPKQLKISKKAMLNSAIATGEFFDLKEGHSALCCLPTKYIAGKMMLVRAMVLGWHIDVVAPDSKPMQNSDKQYDFVAMVPLQVENSIQDLYRIKKLLIGGAKVNQELAKKIVATNCEAYESYSMTETVTHIALKKIGEQRFKTLPNVTVSVDSRECLVVEAPQLNPEQIVTNDLVELISPSEFIWKGRVDNVINSGGIKLFPEQIEEKLQPYVNQRFFVAGIEDDLLGQRLVLIIEGEEFLLDDVVFSALEKYEKPKAIYFVNQFLETETGKIKRKEILLNFKN